MEPDPRFVLANERTLLAWARTSLAFIAGGLAVANLLPAAAVPGGRGLLGVALAIVGALMAVGGYVRWWRADRALRADQPLPTTVLPLLLTGAVVAVALAAAGIALRAA